MEGVGNYLWRCLYGGFQRHAVSTGSWGVRCGGRGMQGAVLPNTELQMKRSSSLLVSNPEEPPLPGCPWKAFRTDMKAEYGLYLLITLFCTCPHFPPCFGRGWAHGCLYDIRRHSSFTHGSSIVYVGGVGWGVIQKDQIKCWKHKEGVNI